MRYCGYMPRYTVWYLCGCIAWSLLELKEEEKPISAVWQFRSTAKAKQASNHHNPKMDSVVLHVAYTDV